MYKMESNQKCTSSRRPEVVEVNGDDGGDDGELISVRFPFDVCQRNVLSFHHERTDLNRHIYFFIIMLRFAVFNAIFLIFPRIYVL